MKRNMMLENKRYLNSVLFFTLVLLSTTFPNRALSQEITVDTQWLRIFYDRGRQAYENNDWCTAVENLYLYYQLNGGNGSFNNNQVFQKEVGNALQHAENQMRGALAENTSLKSQLEDYQSKNSEGVSTKYQGLSTNKPDLRQTPPDLVRVRAPRSQ
jgi:hypothetical protein